MRDHQGEFRIAAMCRVLKVERSGFYALLAKPLSARAIDDARILKLIEESYLVSGGVYGSRNIRDDLIEAGEKIGKHRVYERRDVPNPTFPVSLIQDCL